MFERLISVRNQSLSEKVDDFFSEYTFQGKSVNNY